MLNPRRPSRLLFSISIISFGRPGLVYLFLALGVVVVVRRSPFVRLRARRLSFPVASVELVVESADISFFFALERQMRLWFGVICPTVLRSLSRSVHFMCDSRFTLVTPSHEIVKFSASSCMDPDREWPIDWKRFSLVSRGPYDSI